MLKEIRFKGFGSRPDILAHLEALQPNLEQEIGRWAHRVEVVLELKQTGLDRRPFVWLTLSLTLPQSAASYSAVAAFEDIERPNDFRVWVRQVWGGVLDKLLKDRAEEWERDVTLSTGG